MAPHRRQRATRGAAIRYLTESNGDFVRTAFNLNSLERKLPSLEGEVKALLANSMSASLEIIIVNWNSGSHLRRCLDSIRDASREGFDLGRVVVVDNASTDGSADDLCYPDLALVFLRNSENVGFAAACNQGVNGSRADYVLFLNPDTTLAPESLTAPIQFMEKPGNSKVGACGIQLVDEQGQVLRACSRFLRPIHFFVNLLGLNRLSSKRFQNDLMRDWDHLESRQVDAVTGAFLLLRREIFEALGGFDEKFFVYLEDLDFLHAVHEAGWQCYYLATTRAYHRGGGCSEQAKAARLFYSLQSRILYSYKHFGRAAVTGVLVGTLLVEPFLRVALGVGHGSLLEIRDTFRAYGMLWRRLPRIAAKDREFPTGRSLNKDLGIE
jgi:N-acetylglucosaminyl-diphospho-decaprenol L-rhamnosyltransferase